MYDRELAMQICKELGIKWDADAKRATVNGEPLPEVLVPEDIFSFGYDDGD